jgi:hypothetical protein
MAIPEDRWMAILEDIWKGQWKYQSYRPVPGSVPAVAADPVASLAPPAFVPWSKPGEVTIDAGGATGKLVFPAVPTIPPLKLTFKFTVGNPAMLSISASLMHPVIKFTNELQGWLVPATLTLGVEVDENTPLVVRGSIVQTSEDIVPIDKQPIFTTGFFVLEPL